VTAEVPRDEGASDRVRVKWSNMLLLRPSLVFRLGLSLALFRMAEGGLRVLRMRKLLSFCRITNFLGDSINSCSNIINRKTQGLIPSTILSEGEFLDLENPNVVL
jgi:hypothetical protein